MPERAQGLDEHGSPSCRFTFERRSSEGERAGRVGGSYSRAAWLPVLGPTAWLVWRVLADRLVDDARIDCSLEVLGEPFGFPPEDVSWGLLQLARYGLAVSCRDDHWQVSTSCPPLPDRLVPAASSTVRAMHRRRVRPPEWTAPRALLRGSEAFRRGSSRLRAVRFDGPRRGYPSRPRPLVPRHDRPRD